MFERGSMGPYFFAVALAMAMLLFDLSLPLGVAAGVPYVALVLSGTWFRSPRHVYALAVVGTVLTFIGFVLSPPGGIYWVVITNRLLAVFAIWVTAILLSQRMNKHILLGETKEQMASARSRLLDAFESVPTMMALYDADGRFVHCNKQYRETLKEIEDMLVPGTSLYDISVAGAERGMVEGYQDNPHEWARLRMERLRSSDEPIIHQQQDGRWVMTTDHITRDGSTFVTRSDITALKEAETVALTAQQEAEKANRLKSLFLANMSHELRTPLNAIIGFSDLLRLDTFGFNLPDRALDYIDDIHRSGIHLLGLVNDVLDMTKVEAGKMTFDDAEVHLNKLVNDCFSLVEKEAVKKNLSFEFSCDCTEWFVIKADPARLRQVVLNILSNAVKYNRTDGSITVWCEQLSPTMGRLNIKDTGQGIADAFRDSLFEPFSRGEHLQTTTQGTGIGLSISRKIIEAMGGEISYESRIGEGSTFHIDLPFVDKAERVEVAATGHG